MVTMKTLRYAVCPCCSRSMSPKALEHQEYGRFEVDVRVAGGRKGFPHVATEELNTGERELVRKRLLGTIQAAIEAGILTPADLGIRSPMVVTPRSVGESVSVKAIESVSVKAIESVTVRVSESIRVRVREET